MTTYAIPNITELLVDARPQTFSAQLGNSLYNMKLAWNRITNCWVLDIFDMVGNLLIGGIALVTGADLLGQFVYVGLGGQMTVVSDWSHDPSAVPGFNDLGITGHIYFIQVVDTIDA